MTNNSLADASAYDCMPKSFLTRSVSEGRNTAHGKRRQLLAHSVTQTTPGSLVLPSTVSDDQLSS